MFLLCISLLPARHLGKISSAHSEHLLEVSVGQILVKARGIAAVGVRTARLQSLKGELSRRGQTLNRSRSGGWLCCWLYRRRSKWSY